MGRMTPDRWREVEALFDGAVDLEPAERSAFLDLHCGDDAELRRAVDQLLASSDRAENMFERPPVHVARQLISDEAPRDRDHVAEGDVIGAYRIARLLGRGGMGAVYLAERADGQYRKQVALKIVKRGMDTEEILTRFRRERQILARLEHPNIAGLVDGGATPTGLPYFVMELTEGDPIDAWCDEQRATVDERLRLFLTVCDAVQYAHRNLVVHRDLKPSNILVCDGVPKLLDFGIAKMLADEDIDGPPVTQLYSRRLTPEYAAPEQINGDATTTATDVYSLGVILHELLTGRSPYGESAGSLTRIESVLQRTDTRPPSTVVAKEARSAGREEMEQIATLRGTRADALRDKLRGDLDAIVTKALQQDPERRYATAAALADDIRRHLTGEPVIARPDTAIYRWSKFVRRNRRVVGLAAAGVAALVLGIVGTTWQALEATRARNEATDEAGRARAARDVLINTFAGLNPEHLQGRTTFTREEILSAGRENLDRLEGQPLLHASVINTLGQVMFSLGDLDQAYRLFYEAYELLQPLGRTPELAGSLAGLGEVLRQQTRFEEAERLFGSALRIRESTQGDGSPEYERAKLALAFIHYNKGSDSSLVAAEELYREALAYSGEHHDEIRARALEGLGDVYGYRGGLTADGRGSDEAQASFRRADEFYRQAIEAYKRVYGQRHATVGVALRARAQNLVAAGAFEQAEQPSREALAPLEITYGTNHPFVLEARYTLGEVLFEQRRFGEAEEQFSIATSIAETVYPWGHPYSVFAWDFIGLARQNQGNIAGAIDAFERSISENARPGAAPGQEDPFLEFHLGRALLLDGSAREAIGHLRTADTIWQDQSSPPSDAESAIVALSQAYQALGRVDSAAHYSDRASRLKTSAIHN